MKSDDVAGSGLAVDVPDALLSAAGRALRDAAKHTGAKALDTAVSELHQTIVDSGMSYTPGVASGIALEMGPPLPPTAAGALDSFVTAARRLKAAELEFRAAQAAYAEAVKELSEEATK